MKKLIFPDYEKIKKLPLFYIDDDLYEDENQIPYEYKFKIFDIYADIYCRIVYNEDGNKQFYLDIMSGGYCDQFADSDLKFKATKDGYKKMCSKANKIYNEILNNLIKSNEKYSNNWFKD